MSGLEVNKIIAVIIMAILIVTMISVIGDLIVNVNGEKKQAAYKIDLPEVETDLSKTAKKGEFVEPISGLLMNASLEKGEKIFKKCGSCHNYKKGSANKVGPNLWNIINRPKASAEGFAYSKALIELGGEWTYEEIAGFLYKPKEYAKGTKMNFAGLKKVEDLSNLILFLREQSDNTVPLP
jgi:cytochrome c